MKHISLMILFAAITLSGMAQTIGEEMYIFRNNGQINGFLPDEILSMEYSYYDADSVKYEEIVTQVVNTVDSVYMIPLAEIDSISFVTPKTEYQPDAINLSEQLMPYVISSDSLTILLSKATPSSILPAVGNKLVTLEMNEKFPYGFAGEVTAIKEVNEGFSIECTLTNLEDIFITYYNTSSIYGYYTSEENSSFVGKRAPWYEDPTNWGIDSDINIPKLSFSYGVELNRYRTPNDNIAGSLNTEFSIGITPSLHVISTMIIRRETGLYFMASITGKITLEEQLSFSGGIGWSHDIPFGIITFPLPNCPVVNYYFQPGIFFNASATLSVAAKWTQAFTFGAAFEVVSRGNEAIRPTIGGRMASADFDVEGSINGRFATGLYMETGFNVMCREVTRACVRGELGAEFVGHYVLSNSDVRDAENDTRVYERLKSSNYEINAFTNTIVEHRTGRWGHTQSLDPWNLTVNLFNWEVVPTFSNVSLESVGSNSLHAKAEAEVIRNLMNPVNVGFALFDENGNNVGSYYVETMYQRQTSRLEYTFSNVDTGHTYTVHPIVRLNNIEMLASPSADVDLEKCPVTISDFMVTKSQYEKGCFTHDGVAYDYRFDVSVTATLDEDIEGVADWGYVYLDPNGNEAFISLKQFGYSYTDTRYAYFRNENPSTCTLYGYVKYVGSNETFYGEPYDYPLEYESTITVHTLSASNIGESSATIAGKVEGYTEGLDDGEVGFYYNTTDNPSQGNGQGVSAGRLSSISDGDFQATLSNLQQDKTYYYRTYYYSDGEYTYGETRSFKTNKSGGTGVTSCPNGNHPHWIDLGLPSGTQWRCCNEGVSAPEAYGGYYAFGQVSSAPTKEQIQELIDYCSSEWTTLNGVYGGKFTGPNGGTIFLPAAGYRWVGGFSGVGSIGLYWSSAPNYEYYAYSLRFDPNSGNWNYGDYRNIGHSVRPVR